VFERFTDSARQVLVLALEEARLLNSSFIGTEHVLLGLMREQDGIAARVLGLLDISVTAVREGAAESIGLSGTSSTGSPPFTPRAKKVLELSLREAMQLGSSEIGPEHLLLGLVREGEGVGAQVLISLGIDLDVVRQQVIREMAEKHGESPAERLPYVSIAPTGNAPQARMVVCSFCGLAPPKSGQLISGDNAFICERCIRQWSVRMGTGSTLFGPSWVSRSPMGAVTRDTWVSRASSDIVAPGEQPIDPDLAEAEIVAIFTDYGALSADGRSAIRIEKGDNLGWAVAAARENRPAYLDQEIIFAVDEIIFVEPEHAAVWYSIFVNGGQVLNRHRADALVVDGVWKMARSTFCEIMAMAGVGCPPDPD
jgi:Clp amino terminal domain, pathogenicity island component/ClpX C4-type zinc finger